MRDEDTVVDVAALVAQAEAGNEEARRQLEQFGFFAQHGELRVQGIGGEVAWVRLGSLTGKRDS